MRWTQEGGGYIATCTCRWLRFEAEKPKLEKAVTAHLKSCKKAVQEA